MTDSPIEQMARAIEQALFKYGLRIVGGGCRDSDKDKLEALAIAAEQAHQDCLKEQGLVVVPREPTEAMLSSDTVVQLNQVHYWKSMLTAYEQDK